MTEAQAIQAANSLNFADGSSEWAAYWSDPRSDWGVGKDEATFWDIEYVEEHITELNGEMMPRYKATTEVWDLRACKTEYKGSHIKRFCSGGFIVCEWVTGPGLTATTISWDDIHVVYRGAPLQEPQSNSGHEFMAQELENIFMKHVPLSTLEGHFQNRVDEGRLEGRSLMKEELRELIGAAPLEPC